MSNRKKIIVVGIFLILLVIFSIIYVLLPKIIININNEKIINLKIGENYEEAGASAYLQTIFSKKNLSVSIKGTVNNEKIGTYIITYNAKNEYLEQEVVRIVNVIDDEKPNITFKKDVIGCKKNNLIEYDIIATDNYDGTITNKVQYKLNNAEEITFFVKDSSNNETKITKKIKYIDNEKPLITLQGAKNINLKIGDNYEEYGATATDSCDGNITNSIKITGAVDTDKPGIYEIRYTVQDNSNQKSNAIRYVTVSEDTNLKSEYKVINGATIYLTFDDGPGPYTEDILKILEEYDIKATFFVTAQFPNYLYLIKEEYESEHAIGIHSYSHKWSIYESVENYLEDFRKIENIIYEQTGYYTKLFRFPGGSSNTVSRNYSKGIMTKLSTQMENEGYIYFDWTFDSGDTSKKNNSVEDIMNNFKKNLKGDGEYIVLMHDIKENTLKALPDIIKFAQANGYEFAKLTETSPTARLKIAN